MLNYAFHYFKYFKIKYLYISVKYLFISFFVYFFLYIAGLTDQLLIRKTLDDLTLDSGILHRKWEGRNYTYYLEKANGSFEKYKFDLINLSKFDAIDSYENKYVNLMHHRKFVYQIENIDGYIIFSLYSANEVIKYHNEIMIFLYSMIIYVLLYYMKKDVSACLNINQKD